MPIVLDPRFTAAAKQAAELQRASDVEQWRFMELALAMGLGSAGLASPPQGMPHVELFPIAPQPR